MSSTSTFIAARDFLQQHRTDYQAAYDGFKTPVMAEFNWAIDFFDVQAKDNQATALWLVDDNAKHVKVSYAEMSASSNQVANQLRAWGVRRGDSVLLMLPNELALWETMLACMKLGAVLIPTTMLLSAGDLQDRIERGAVKHVVALASEAAKFETLAGAFTRIIVGGQAPGWQAFEQAYQAERSFTPDGVTRSSDPLFLYFTSGTTSKPKLVLHSHQSYPVGHLSTMYWLGLKKGDIHWNISSPGWAKHAWSCFFAPWIAGATIFVYNYARFNAAKSLDVICECGVTSLCAPPTVWRMMIQENLNNWKVPLRELVGAGEPLNPEVIDQVERAWGIRIRDGFGQTETTAQIGNPPGQPIKPGSMGRPLPGYRIALLDADDKPADEGEISIVLDPRPVGLMLEYAGDPEKTAEVIRDGHYHTGDVAMRDADGYYHYIGRNDDVFKSSDYRLSPFELESILIEHEAVLEAAVVPSPDALRLSVPKAFISLREGFFPDRDTAASILDYSREKLAPYKRIRRVEFTELPKTISGKIRRVQLRKKELERSDNSRNPGEFWEEDLA